MRSVKDSCNNETMFNISRRGGKCWKKNPNCDDETKQLVESVKKEKEQNVLQDW